MQLFQIFLAAATLSFPEFEEYNEKSSNLFMNVIHALTLTASLESNVDFQPIIILLLRIFQKVLFLSDVILNVFLFYKILPILVYIILNEIELFKYFK